MNLAITIEKYDMKPNVLKYVLNMTIIKKRVLIRYIFLIGMFLFINACKPREGTTQQSSISMDELAESLEKANRYLVRTEEEDINDFVQRHTWVMNKTGTGLRYWIDTANGSGDKVAYGQRVGFHYKVRLLNGDQIYSSDESGPKAFIAGKGGVETGLEEGIKLLRRGDKAKFILPSHLAFGLLGDGDKIPPKTPIIYELEVINLQ